MKKTVLALGIAVAIPAVSQAQRYLGVATSNWSGTNSLYLNPANIADSRHKFTIDLFSVNASLDNNLSSISFSDFTSYATKSTEDRSISDLFTFQNKDKFSLTINGEVRGPGAMVSLGQKHSIALTTRVRTFNQINDMDQRLFRNIIDKQYSNAFAAGATAKAGPFNYTSHIWSEIGLSYGAVIWEKEKHQIKGGVTARYLMGSGYVNVKNTNLDLTYFAQSDSVRLSNTDLSYGSNLVNDNLDDIGDNLLKANGTGFGADLGVTYEFRPKHASYRYDMDGKTNILDESKNKYLFRVSLAVTDIGGINYKDGNQTARFSGTGTVRGSEIPDTVKNYSSFRNYMVSKGFANTTSGEATKLNLPTMFVGNVDVNIYKGFYANVMYMANLRDRNDVGNTYYNQFTVTPRYDSRVFSLGVPITYNALTSAMNAGIGARVGGFVIGSDNLFSFSETYGANFYMGLSVNFNKRKPKDSDGDLISNKRDNCPNEKGVIEMKGCPNPDKDGDGVLDKDDKCPDIAGSKTAMGCPDADLDSVADAEDRCPQDAGLVSMQGCPDRDNDAVADIDDICPDEAGLPQFKGCPDTDNDGVPDNEDKCPKVAGPVASEGCPDTDSDGVSDNLDKCPTVPGTVNNSGCPEVSVDVKKRLAFAATAIQFETGKAVIKKTSFKLLDEIVTILNNYPDYMMTIDGHTDDVGSDVKNLQLSKDRANSVKNYFVSKGISTDRVATNGFGESQPAASNKTAAGRAKNRRVAMDLKLK